MALAKSPLSPSGYSGLLKARQVGVSAQKYMQPNNGQTSGTRNLHSNQPTGVTRMVAGAPADPFAPMSSGDINRTVNRFAGMYGTPQSDSQIQTSAQGMVDPIIAAITKSINDRTAQSATNITGNANSLASSLGKIDWNAPYASAESGQAAVDSELRNALAGGGEAQGADLQARLAGINDPTVAAAGDALASRGSAIGGTEVANGSANLGALLAQAAAAKTYGLKLPGIARLSGLQDVAGVNQQAVTDIGNANTSLLGQLPSIVQSLRSDNQSLRANRAGAAANEFNTLTGQNITKATAQAGFNNTQTQLGLPDATLSRAYGYAVDAQGNPVGGQVTPLPGYQVGSDGSVTKTPKAVAAPKPLSPATKAKLAKTAEDLRYGVAPKQQYNSKTGAWMDVPNTGTPNSSYDEAYQQLVAAGATPAYARAQVNRLYKPGEFGRPKSAGQKKTDAAVQSGVGIPPDPYAKWGH